MTSTAERIMNGYAAEGLLLPEQAARRLGITKATYSTWARMGTIPGAFQRQHVRGPAGVWLITPEDLAAFMASAGESPPTPNGHADHPEPAAPAAPAAPPDDGLLTAAEAAARLGVNPTTLTSFLSRQTYGPLGRKLIRPGEGRAPKWMLTEAEVATIREARAGMTGRVGRPLGSTNAPPEPPPEGGVLALAEQLVATANALVRALRREQDQKARVANELVKLLDPGRRTEGG